MNYELAKKLKDAGFEQKSGPVWVHVTKKHIKDRHTGYTYLRPEGWVYHDFVALPQKGLAKAIEWCSAPRLSELIEACGDKFECLYRIVNPDYSLINWKAYAFGVSTLCVGSSAEEVVANLWLVLNTKK